MPLVALSISNATTSELMVMQADVPALHSVVPPIKLAEFQVCKPATGSCANCHFFIPDNPPGCGGLMRKSAPGDSPRHNKTNKPDKPSQAAAELPKPGDVWKAHKDGRPITHVITRVIIQTGGSNDEQRGMDLKDIPLPTCFPCPPSQNVFSGGTSEGNGGMGLPDVHNNQLFAWYEVPLFGFPPPTCLPCPPATTLTRATLVAKETNGTYYHFPAADRIG